MSKKDFIEVTLKVSQTFKKEFWHDGINDKLKVLRDAGLEIMEVGGRPVYETCEGCCEPFFSSEEIKYDNEGVPLCNKCLDGLKCEHWDQYPRWANWEVIMPDGEVWIAANEPTTDGIGWQFKGKSVRVGRCDHGDDWQHSKSHTPY